VESRFENSRQIMLKCHRICVTARHLAARGGAIMSKTRIIVMGLATTLAVGVAASAQAQPPGWSRGQQNLAISYDECVRRMAVALQAEGYGRDANSGGNFVAGTKGVHTAVIICSPAPNARMLVQIVVASNGDGGGYERQKLQARMEGLVAQPPQPPQPQPPSSSGVDISGI